MQIVFKAIALLSVAVISACSDAPAAPKKRERVMPVFKSETHIINATEKVTVMEIPDGYSINRCMAYTNTETNTSTMRCDFDAFKTELPRSD